MLTFNEKSVSVALLELLVLFLKRFLREKRSGLGLSQIFNVSLTSSAFFAAIYNTDFRILHFVKMT